eukprot:scaffold30393_cov47-Attheya_sp.AAC.3
MPDKSPDTQGPILETLPPLPMPVFPLSLGVRIGTVFDSSSSSYYFRMTWIPSSFLQHPHSSYSSGISIIICSLTRLHHTGSNEHKANIG